MHLWSLHLNWPGLHGTELQNRRFSSAASPQSLSPSHSHRRIMQTFVLGHLTSRSVVLHAIGGQPTSSVLLPSWQSMTPLHLLANGMHLKFLHWNSVSALQVGYMQLNSSLLSPHWLTLVIYMQFVISYKINLICMQLVEKYNFKSILVRAKVSEGFPRKINW